MEQIKIGKFISECRKKKGLTQKELAEKINVTDKAISKWETGRGIPDSSIMIDLCKELNITANELLSGEYLKENYQENAERNLLELNRKNEKKRNTIIFIISITLILLIIAVGELFYVLLEQKKSQLDTVLQQAESDYYLNMNDSDLYNKINSLEKRIESLEKSR